MQYMNRFLIRQVIRIRFLSLLLAQKCIYSNNEQFIYRLFTKHDSIDELTRLINIAYKANAEKGMNYLGARQDAATTRKRIRKGICIIVIHEKKIIGTITYKSPHKTKGSKWYKKGSVAKFNMLAVAPGYQKQGIANHLITVCEQIALKHGARELALDTAENNTALIDYYSRRNYRFIETVKWRDTNYASVVYSKRLA